MKAMSAFLQKSVGPMIVRTLLTLVLCVTNFLLAYGIAHYYSLGGSPVLMIITLIVTLILVAILAVPNLEPEPKE